MTMSAGRPPSFLYAFAFVGYNADGDGSAAKPFRLLDGFLSSTKFEAIIGDSVNGH